MKLYLNYFAVILFCLSQIISLSSFAQDITVSGGNLSFNEYTNGSTVDYGNVGATFEQFIIQNNGTSDLSITNITLSNNNGHYTLFYYSSVSFPLVVASQDSFFFDVDFSPLSSGTLNNTLIIESNDPDTPTYTINLTGESSPPEAQVNVDSDPPISSGSSVNFGSGEVNVDVETKTFTIENTGDADLFLDGIVIAGDGEFNYSIDIFSTDFHLPIGFTTTFDVTFQPVEVGTLEAFVLIYSNDPNNNPFVVNIAGQGTEVINDPSALTATANNETGISLSWTDNSSNEDGFYIFLSLSGEPSSFDNILATVDSDVTNYTDNSLAPNQTGYYRVQAFNDRGSVSNKTSTASATTKNPPASPELITETYSNSQINLLWILENEGTGFVIERSSNVNEGFKRLDTLLSADTYLFEDKDVQSNTEYFYRVQALGTQGNSNFSNVSGAETSSVPLPPNALETVLDANQNVVLNWVDNSDNEDIFIIERLNFFENEGRFREIARVSANTTTFTDTTASPNQEYDYIIRASNGNGFSALYTIFNPNVFTDEILASILGNSLEYFDRATLIAYNFSSIPPDSNVTAPSLAPQELRAEPVSFSEILLSWRPVTIDANSNSTNDFIEFEVTGGDDEITGQVSALTDRVQVTGLEKNQLYYIQIRHGNDGGFSPYSEEISIRTQCNLIGSISDESGDVAVEICSGKTAFLSVNSNVLNADYQWLRNDLPIPDSNQDFYYATEDGEYSCIIRTSESDCFEEVPVPVVVTLKASTEVNISQIDNVLEADLTNANTYQWYRDELKIDGATSFRYEPTQNGLYHVVTSLEGCSTTSNFIFYTTTSIDETVSDEIVVYPNPTSNDLNLIWENDYLGEYQLNLYDMQGKQYALKNAQKSSFVLEENLDLSVIPSGNYLLEMVGEDFRAVKKIVKK